MNVMPSQYLREEDFDLAYREWKKGQDHSIKSVKSNNSHGSFSMQIRRIGKGGAAPLSSRSN